MRHAFKQPFQANSPTITAYQPVAEEFVLDSDINGPFWYASRVSIPPTIDPGGIVDVEVEITQSQVVISPLRDNVCAAGSITSGLGSVITVDPEWTYSESTELCTGLGGFTPEIDVAEFDFPAPTDSGTYTISVSVEGIESGGGTVDYEILVGGDEEDDRPDPDPDDPDDGGGGGGIFPGDGDGDDGNGGDLPRLPFLDSFESGLVALVVILATLLWLSFQF